MVIVTVLKPFYDLHLHVDHRPGDTFEATEERAKHIDSVLPGYIKYEAKTDYESMTLQQLTAIAKERGVMPKGRVAKATLIEILSKE